jgi:branched-chain amino acid transport system permease protein
MTNSPPARPAIPHEAPALVNVREHSAGPAAGRRRLRGWVAAALFACAAVYALFGASAFNQYEACLIAVYAVAALGQDWLMGRAGQVSLGAAAFMAIGAYTTGGLANESWAPFPVPIAVSGIFGGAVGLLVGITGLRFRGLYLALSTLALQFIVAFAGQRYQGSNEAGLVVGIPHLGSLNIGTGRGLLITLLVILVLVVLTLNGMYRRAPGRAWAAIKQNEQAAAVAGVNVTKWKLLAFVGSSAVIAIGGSMYAYVIGIVNYVPFSLDLAISILAAVFVGGLSSISGALIGAVLIVLLPNWLQDLSARLPGSGSGGSWLSNNSSQLAVAIYGLVLLLVLLFERDGIVGLVNRGVDQLSGIRRRRRDVTDTSQEAGQ